MARVTLKIMLWPGVNQMVVLESHTPVKSKLLGKMIVLQCPNDLYDVGKRTKAYKNWYNRERKRAVADLARQGHPTAQRDVARRRKNQAASNRRLVLKRRALADMWKYDDAVRGPYHDEAAENVDYILID